MNKELIRELKELRKRGYDDNPNNILRLYEMFKQMSNEVEDLKDELSYFDEEYKIQFKITEPDFYFYVIMKNKLFDYSEGITEEDSATIECKWEIMKGMMTGDINGTSAYLSGDLNIIGSMEAVTEYTSYLELIINIINQYSKGK